MTDAKRSSQAIERCRVCDKILTDLDYFEDGETALHVVLDGDAEPPVIDAGPWCMRCWRKRVGLERSERLRADAEAADLSAWLRAQRLGLSPDAETSVMVAVYDWISTYRDDRVQDVLTSLSEDIGTTANGGPAVSERA